MFGCRLTAGGGSPFCHLEEQEGSERLRPRRPPATGEFTPQAGVKHSSSSKQEVKDKIVAFPLDVVELTLNSFLMFWSERWC